MVARQQAPILGGPAVARSAYDPRVRVEVRLLGGFAVSVDGDQTPAGRWSRRPGAALVKLLALSPGGRLHRDRVIDALWPELTVDAALPRLHKAAHYARLAVEQRTAVVLRDEVVALFPGDDVQVDVVKFESAALAVLSEQPVSPRSCAGSSIVPPTCSPTTSAHRGWTNRASGCGCCPGSSPGRRDGGTTYSGSSPRTRRRTSN